MGSLPPLVCAFLIVLFLVSVVVAVIGAVLGSARIIVAGLGAAVAVIIWLQSGRVPAFVGRVLGLPIGSSGGKDLEPEPVPVERQPDETDSGRAVR